MSKTRELWRKHSQERQRMARELAACARSEFPKGARVRWVHTYKQGDPVYREGVVDKVGDYRITVRSKSGAAHELDLSSPELVA